MLEMLGTIEKERIGAMAGVRGKSVHTIIA